MIVEFALKEGYDVEGLTFSPITVGMVILNFNSSEMAW